jgi:hypothetical protein
MKNHLKVNFRSDPENRKKQVYAVRGRVWIWSSGSSGAWHFVTIPAARSREIRHRHGGTSRGWGSIPVVVTLGKSVWKTSIFPYSKVKAYILPLKAEVRKKEGVRPKSMIAFTLAI